MSGITLDQIAEAEVGTEPKLTGPQIEEEMQQPEPNRMNELFSRIFTAETGEGSIGEYIEHPMNFNKSYGLAQMLRGVTGIAGNLKLAVIDIGFGFLRFSKERKEVINHVDIPGRGDSVT
jgi:hypothetical protein